MFNGFGNNNNNTGGGLNFNNNNTGGGGGLNFGGGGAATGGGGLLFGNKAQTPNSGFSFGQSTTNSGNMFGPKPTTGGLLNFGTTPAAGNNIPGIGMFNFSQQTPSGQTGQNNSFGGNRQGNPYYPQEQNLKMIEQFYKSLFDSDFFKNFQKSTPFDKLK